MQTDTPHEDGSPFGGLLTAAQFQQLHAGLFPTVESLRRAARACRPQLTDAGAIIQVRGRVFLHEEKASKVLFNEGLRAAARRVK